MSRGRPGPGDGVRPAHPGGATHIIHPCAVELTMMMLTPIVRELGLERRVLRLIEAAPFYAYLHPDVAALTFGESP